LGGATKGTVVDEATLAGLPCALCIMVLSTNNKTQVLFNYIIIHSYLISTLVNNISIRV
jgi:uncharacterized membrane protein YciS (DUF1049 family)